MTKILFALSALLIAFMAVNHFMCSSKALAPEIKGLKDIKIVRVAEDTLKLKLTVIAENKNMFSVSFNDLNLSVINDRDTLGEAYNKKQLNIPGKSSQDVEVNVNLQTSKVADMLTKDEDTLKLKLRGSVNADMTFASMPVDIDIPFTLPLKDELYKSIQDDTRKENIITISSASLQEVGLNESQVKIEFSLKNPYALKFKMKSYPSKIYINGSYAGDGDLMDEMDVSSNSIRTGGKFLFRVNNFQSVASVLRTILSGELKYETRGNLHLEIAGKQISLPYTSKGVLVKL